MMLVREGETTDFRAYVNGRDFPAAWCAGEPEGLVVLDDASTLVAIAMVTVDDRARTWIWFDQRIPLSAVILHRHALSLLNALRAGERIVYAFPDTRLPGVQRWFERLGFRPAGLMLHPTGEERMAWQRN